MEIKECKLNHKGKCTVYLKPCVEIDDCAVKLLIRKSFTVTEFGSLSNLFTAEKNKL